MAHTSSSTAARTPPHRSADTGNHQPGNGGTDTIAVQVEHLRKAYGGRLAVRDVSFSVAPGEIFGILGPNGAGKTTIVECAQGLRRPDGGVVRVLGHDVRRDGRGLRRLVGSQLQSSALPDRLKVWEALDLFASMNGRGTDWRVLLERWGLADKANTSFADLSGGQAQRLFVALALLGRPQVVFLDELTQGLDPAGRRVAWELIREIRDGGTTVVLVTHYMDEAEQLCDRLVVIDHGRVVAQGTPQELIADLASGIRATFSTDAADVSWLSMIEAVDELTRHGRHVQIRGSGPVLALVASALVDHQIVPVDLRVDQPTLEDAYMHLTTPTGTRQDRCAP
jgi:ABC-2 type transport system ATP-binding protein